ncbi:hypothetical protein [Streptomyces sp. NEAU-S7GS2]|uniref:hypothetical protein n=1 Tax=Streptomyces sp. NEAU-S7GS2 TaxID=2202000 RepID=UPI000D6ED2EE|nr:hypothetical protein [Streptomyces sp. NEAU-S7GS2]AWN32622.1 hypothetical protein DKG71_42350 [Streptomyces sp. NEAU-S7GS2]
MTHHDTRDTSAFSATRPVPQSLESTPDGAPPWIFPGARVYDEVRDLRGEITAVGFPGHDPRQSNRAWVRPHGGGIEWNPFFTDLRPDPETTPARRTT